MKEHPPAAGAFEGSHVQPLFHLLVEDILWTEFRFDFEDFKQTLLHHRVLSDASIVQQIFEIEQDLANHFQEADV